MKRFWQRATVVQQGDGWGISLDGRPVRTPARALLVLSTETLANAIASEWNRVGEKIDSSALPLTGLANAAIDRVAPERENFAAILANYAQGDLTCYRAESPSALVDRQAEQWDPILAWARRRFDVDFVTTTGLMHVPQPAATVDRLSHALSVPDPFSLAGLSPLVTIGGSLLAALAVLEKAMTAHDAWTAVSVDDCWQLEQWGSDAEAEAALENRRADFMAAASLLALLEP